MKMIYSCGKWILVLQKNIEHLSPSLKAPAHTFCVRARSILRAPQKEEAKANSNFH